jgi:type IV secretory pathway VirB2 component (pilin)
MSVFKNKKIKFLLPMLVLFILFFSISRTNAQVAVWWLEYKDVNNVHSIGGYFNSESECLAWWSQNHNILQATLVKGCFQSATMPEVTPEPSPIPLPGDDDNSTPTQNTPPANPKTTYTLLAPLPFMEGDSQTIDTQKSDTNPCPFGNYLNILIKIFLGICAVLAVIMIVMGGIEYMTSDLASSKESGKKTITSAILGLLLALGAYLILKTINPELLNVCLNNLPEVSVTVESGREYRLTETQAVDRSTGFVKTSYYDQIKSISTQMGIPNCLLQVAIQRESHGNISIGHDEDVPSPNVLSRRNFLASGKKFDGTTFPAGDKNDSRIKDHAFKNTDHPSDYRKAPSPTASDLGLDWRFSHSVGLFGVTFGPNNLNPSGAQAIYNSPSADVQQAATMMKAFYAKCNSNIESTWRAYNSGSCTGNNAFTNTETAVRMSLYNQCVAQDH